MLLGLQGRCGFALTLHPAPVLQLALLLQLGHRRTPPLQFLQELAPLLVHHREAVSLLTQYLQPLVTTPRFSAAALQDSQDNEKDRQADGQGASRQENGQQPEAHPGTQCCQGLRLPS